MSIDSLTELSGYISDILTEDQLTSQSKEKQPLDKYDDYYNDGSNVNTDFSQELDQLEQWVKDQTVDPTKWFDEFRN